MSSIIQESRIRAKSILVHYKIAQKTNTSSWCESLFSWISIKVQKLKPINSLYLLIVKVLCIRKLMFHSKID